jgi:hypothetical protein
MSDWQVVGGQRIRIDEDLITWEVHGDLLADELAHIFGVGMKVQNLYGYTLFLILTDEKWWFPPEARQRLAQFHQEHKAIGATAIVGLAASKRVFIELVLRAVTLVSGRHPTTRFFRTREDGLLWLAEQRQLGQKGLLKR